METSSKVCQSCSESRASVIESSDVPTQPYHLCVPCHERLLSSSLRPIEWYNLAVIHSPMNFWLHDDFYEEDGEATQPEEDVIVTEKDLAPSLEDVQEDVEALIDFAITRWSLEEDVLDALKNHHKTKILESIKPRFIQTETYEIKSRMLDIARDVLGSEASEWIRELWIHDDGELLIDLSEATASCLPASEGLPLVFRKLEALTDKEKNACVASCLYRFRSPIVLPWIEKNCRTFHGNWGLLAAVSYPTWEMMKSWLNKGRPLSLVALDSMEACANEGRHLIIAKYKPQILETVVSEIEPVIKGYLQQDSVPRVKNKSEWILDDKDIIFTSNTRIC